MIGRPRFPKRTGHFSIRELMPALIYRVYSRVIEDVFDMAKIRVGWAKVGKDADPYLINSVFVKGEQFDGYQIFTLSVSR